MLKQERYTTAEYSEMFMFAMTRDNLGTASMIRDHETYFGKKVVVNRGRKVPHGTSGVVVWFGSKNYSGAPIIGICTRIGIKDDAGNVHFTALENVDICKDTEGGGNEN